MNRICKVNEDYNCNTNDKCEYEITPLEEYVTEANGTTNYEKLHNLPSINNVKLIKNKTAKDLKLQEEMDTLTNLDIQKILEAEK